MAAAPTGNDDSNGDSRKKENCLDIDFDDKEDIDMEQICDQCLTTMLNCKCSRRRRQHQSTSATLLGAQTTANASTAATSTVHPQTVQDPLHTGLSQNLQAAEGLQEPHGRPATLLTARLPTTDCNDAQQLYAGYVDDEMLRSSELITAAYATNN